MANRYGRWEVLTVRARGLHIFWRQAETAEQLEAIVVEGLTGELPPRPPRWNLRTWTDSPDLDVWLESAEHTGAARWVATLRLEGHVETYELEILPGPVLHELRCPPIPSLHTYLFDLQALLLRMHAGERFALPFKLRRRWPTPPDPPSLSSS